MGIGSPRERQRSKIRAEVAPVHVLQGDEVAVVDFAEIEDLRDVGVVQLDGDLRLVDEHRDELFVLSDVRRMRLTATRRSNPSTP